MPFTISHIAAILPAHQHLRRWGFFSAAVVGTMVPDFGSMFPWQLPRGATHSAAALLTFCLPWGLLAFWLFQLLIKPAWCAVLPGRWRLRLRAEHPVARIGDWRVWLGAGAAVLVGAITHLVWDGFTHEGARGVRMLPFLDDYGPVLDGHSFRLYRLLQHVSSVAGLFVVAVAAWRWSRGEVGNFAADTPLSSRERHTWLAAYLLIPPSLVIIAAASAPPGPHFGNTLGNLLTRLAFAGLAGVCFSLVAVSALIRLRLARLPNRPLDAGKPLQ